MSNWSKANAKKVVARTKGTKRGRKMIVWKKRRKPQYTPLTWKRPPSMTDGVVRCLYYMFSMDCTKEEACAMAHIAPSTFDAWYNWEYEILWKFKEVWFDVDGNATMVEHEMNAKFYEIIDHAIIQTYVSARQAQRKNIIKWKERTIETFLTTRDPRYKKKLDLASSNFNVTFGNKDTPDSPFIKK